MGTVVIVMVVVVGGVVVILMPSGRSREVRALLGRLRMSTRQGGPSAACGSSFGVDFCASPTSPLQLNPKPRNA